MEDLIVRTATLEDVDGIHALIEAHRTAGHLLPRRRDDIHRHVSRFVVADLAGDVMGCAELVPLSPLVAEIRSLVVSPALRGAGVATDLVEELRQRATSAGFETLCAFTHDTRFFVRQNFSIVPHLWVPQKIAKDCASCALFRQCGQHAMMLPLREIVRRVVPDLVHEHAAVA